MDRANGYMKSGRRFQIQTPGKTLPGYALASITGTVAHYILYILLVRVFSVHAVLASTLGAILGAVIIYLLNYFFIFRSTKKHIEAASKFTVVALMSVGLNGMIVSIALMYVSMHYLIAQMPAAVIVFGVSYLANKIWTFSEENR